MWSMKERRYFDVGQDSNTLTIVKCSFNQFIAARLKLLSIPPFSNFDGIYVFFH
jgi:hypothetical protein